MATTYAMKQVDTDDPEKSKIQRMLAKAGIDRNRHLARMRDVYKYCMPWRHTDDQDHPVDVLDEIFDEEPATVLEDFAADMLQTFTPQKNPWVAAKPVEAFDNPTLKQLAKPLSQVQQVVFAEMARSNLYQALQEAYMDLGPGTMALIVTDIGIAQPIHCEAIPVVDLLLNRGPYGWLSGKWRKRRRTCEDVKTLWPEAVWPKGRAEPKGDVEEIVIDGCYRDWSEKADETWHYVVMFGAEIIYRETYRGKGSCPIIVARWGRDSTTAWGVGPTYRSVPAIKTLNHFRFTFLKNFDKEADPVVSYEDDGVINADHGVEPGTWLPRAPGSKSPDVIESKSRMDIASFNLDETRAALRRAHYQDRPQQQGKTPPTATQWADEAAERARRMGTPATNLVVELQYPLFERFAYLLAKRGKLPKVKWQGQEVALEPVSPLLRAQEQEEVVRMNNFAQMVGGLFGPEAANAIIKQFDFTAKLAEKMGVDPSLTRTEAELQAAMQTLAPLIGAAGGAGGAPPGDAGQPPPGAV